ncbi:MULTISPECIES: glycosyltransferase family 29 protein [unclassified Halomonas]|uniref:glycosyltransferase family 29 protein n=1 Tax=unclassified Halomonas TaxID=2609666 RepID=UPI0040344007
MSKLTKFFKHPVMFFEDAAKNKKLKEGKPKIFVVGFSTWKTYLRMYFSEYDLVFLPKNINQKQFNSLYRKNITILKDSCQVFIWGFKAPEYVLEFLREEKISTKFVEDGFVRSVQLGATKAPPMSLCLDSKTPYFDATRPSELEDLLKNFDFSNKLELLEEAKESIKLIIENGVSKYNNSQAVNVEKIYGPKNKRRILVLGQVEDDASIQYGCEKKLTNNDVVRLAVEENPDAQVIYKPHPDVMNAHRPYQSNPLDVENIALVLKDDVPLANSFVTIDHVYTITSLGGFEALLRGIKVTTLGCPFYSGWGITDDRQSNARRNRTLSVEEVFAISYLIYPAYFDTETGERKNLKYTADKIVSTRRDSGLNLKVEPVSFNDKEEENNVDLQVEKPKIFVIGFSTWKRYLRACFFEYDLIFLPRDIEVGQFDLNYRHQVLASKKSCQVFIWGLKAPEYILKFLIEEGIATKFVEDGFVRSLQLGATKAPPMSLCLDSKTPYFDATRPSELEELLNHFDFLNKPGLLEEAKEGIKLLVETGVSKYNNSQAVNIEKIYGPKNKKRILVLGQVEDDASIIYGCAKKYTNNDVVRLAIEENPDSQVIYKPHPDVLNGHRPYQSNPADVKNIALVLTCDVPLSDAFETIDHVYTITSLGGFEALMRNIKVTTLGCPFYSGWGLTDDRQSNSRRNRSLSLNEIFAISYLVYPTYYKPENGGSSNFFDVVHEISSYISKRDIVKSKNLGKHIPAEWHKKGLDLGLLDPLQESVYISKLPLKKKAAYFQERGKHLEAVGCYDQLIEEKESSDLFLKRAQCKLNLGNFGDQTAYDFKMAISLANGLTHAAYSYFSYEWERRPLSEALLLEFKRYLTMCSVVDKKKPQYGSLLLLFAAMNNEVGKKGEALVRYKQALSLKANASKYLPLCYSISKMWSASVINERTSKLFEKILENKNKFETLVRDVKGSVCVVGNAPNEIGKNKGKLIDSHKLVIRFNSYNVTYPFNKDYGNRTDVWVRMPFHPYVRNDIDQKLKLVMFTGSNRMHRPYGDWDGILDYVESGVPVSFFNPNHFYELQNILGGPPTSGLMICYSLYKMIGPLKRDQCHGFSFSSDEVNDSYHYSDGNAAAGGRHHWDKEAEVFARLVDDEYLKSSPFLRSLLGDKKKYIYDRVISLSPGLFGYNIFGKEVEYLSGKDVVRHIAYVSNAANGFKSEVLESIRRTDKVCFIGFGRASTGERAQELADIYNKDFRLAEYGFISSMHLPSEKQFNFSLVLDSKGIFYDTTSESQIEELLLLDSTITSLDVQARARKNIDFIVDNNITKYNNSPGIVLPQKTGKKRILVIDQTKNDNSIIYGQCEAFEFEDMVKDAVEEGAEVYIKMHPETIAGAKDGNIEVVNKYSSLDEVHVISDQCNIVSLIKQVDEVFVMTSGVGLEALLIGVPVRCYGVPFYAGWGMTTNMTEVSKVRRKLTVESLFAAVFFLYTVYYHPQTKQECSLEECLSWIAENKPQVDNIFYGG